MAFYTFNITTQPVQPVCHSGGSEKAEEPATQVFMSSVTPVTGEIQGGVYGFLAILFLKDRRGIQRGSLKYFK